MCLGSSIIFYVSNECKYYAGVWMYDLLNYVNGGIRFEKCNGHSSMWSDREFILCSILVVKVSWTWLNDAYYCTTRKKYIREALVVTEIFTREREREEEATQKVGYFLQLETKKNVSELYSQWHSIQIEKCLITFLFKDCDAIRPH